VSIDWGAVWQFVAPIVREAVIALLMAVLALLGYDKVVPSRFARLGREEKMQSLGVSGFETSRRHDKVVK
jgi:hypothetical protein